MTLNNLKKFSLEQKFAQGNSSLNAFIKAELRVNNYKRHDVIPLVNELLEFSAVARNQAATSLVEEIYQEFRKAEEEKKRLLTFARRSRRSRRVEDKRAIKAAQALSFLEKTLWEMPEEKLHSYLETKYHREKVLIKDLLPSDLRPRFEQTELMKIKNMYLIIKQKRTQQKITDAYKIELDKQLEKAASFDRMVMALDAIQVGGKILGDCTGGDLLREASRLEEMANQITAQSVFYRQLAVIVGKTTTVREAADRAGIVGLLTTHYKEAA